MNKGKIKAFCGGLLVLLLVLCSVVVSFAIDIPEPELNSAIIGVYDGDNDYSELYDLGNPLTVNDGTILDVSLTDESPTNTGYGVLFELDPESTVDVTLAGGSGVKVEGALAEGTEGDSTIELNGIEINSAYDATVSLTEGSTVVVDAEADRADAYGVILEGVSAPDTASVLLTGGSRIDTQAYGNNGDAFAGSVGVFETEHAVVELSGASTISATATAITADSDRAEAIAVYVDYAPVIDVVLAEGSNLKAIATSQRSDGEENSYDYAYAIALQVDESDSTEKDVTLDVAGSTITAEATAEYGEANAKAIKMAGGVFSSSEVEPTVSLVNSTIDASAISMFSEANAHGLQFGGYTYLDLVMESSVVNAYAEGVDARAKGFFAKYESNIDLNLDNGSIIKAYAMSTDGDADAYCVNIGGETDFTLSLDGASELIAIADATNDDVEASGIDVSGKSIVDISLVGGSKVSVSATAVFVESSDDDMDDMDERDFMDERSDSDVDAEATGILIHGYTTVDNLSLNNASIVVDSDASGTSTAVGIAIDGSDTVANDVSLNAGSTIVATASSASGDASSYGVLVGDYDSGPEVTVDVDSTSSITADWSVYNDSSMVAVNNSGLLAGRLKVSDLNNASTGVLGATFGSADVELSDDEINYFVEQDVDAPEFEIELRELIEPAADETFYFMAESATLSDGTTFLINPTDDLGLTEPGDVANYALFAADGEGEEEGGVWTLDQLNIASTCESPLFSLELNEELSTDTELILTATYLTPEEAGLSGNGTAAFEAADEDGISTFDSNPDEWTPNVSGAFVAGMTQSLGTSHFNIGNRMGALMGMNSGDDVVANNGMWFSVRFTEAEQDKRDSVVGFDSDTAGLSIGIDREFGDTVLGFAYTRGTTDADANDNSADFDMTDNLFSLYGSYDAGAWYSEAILSAGFGSVDGERHVGSDVYASDYDSNSYNAKVEMGMKLNQQGWQINPLFALQYSVKEYDSYTETGSGDLALSVKSQEYSTFTAGLGAAIQKEFQRNWGTFTPEFRGTVNYDIENDRIVSTANFVGGSTSFVAKGVEPSETSWDLGAALTVASLGEENVSFRVGYDYSGREDFEAHSFTGKIRFEF